MNDNAHYDEVARELQAKAVVPGLWTKAFAEAGGQVDRARALYIKHRVAQLAEEAKAKLRQERRAAMEGAKQRAVPRLRRFAYGLSAIVFGLLAFGFGIIGVVLLFIPPPDTEPIGVAVLQVILALLFGFITYKCIKAARG